MNSLHSLVCTEDPTVLFITESWLSPHILDSAVSLPGYYLFRNDRTHSHGGGCIIYVKDHIVVSYFDDSSLSQFPNSIWLHVSTNNSDFLIGCLYNPPNCTCQDLISLQDIFTKISTLPLQSKIIAGDFNLPQIYCSCH